MTATKSRWFVEIFLDGETVRFWNDFEATTFDGETYAPLGDRFTPPDRVRTRANLDSETTKIVFDSSRQTDNTDVLGGLLDSNLRRRQVRLRNVYFTTSPDTGDVVSDTYGRVRSTPDSVRPGDPPELSVEIESGSLAYLERRMQTRSSANQKYAFPDDKGFDLTKALEGKVLAWRTKEVKSGTVEVSAVETSDPAARKLAIGEFATEGTFVAHFVGKTQQKNWFRVYAIADCRIAELNKVWINGNLQVNSALTHGARTLVSLPKDNGESRCWITFYDGRHDQSADSELTTYASAWTSSHKLRGVAYVVIEHQWDEDLPESFDYRFGGKGGLFYDRRKDSTAGGSGAHRLLTPSTWEYTKNLMVVADHYRQGIRIMPSTFTTGGADPSVYWFGVGEAADVIPYDEFEDLADLCDQSVALKAGGTQKRYEVNGMLSASDDHKENLEKLASCMAARAIDQGGRIVFRPVRTQSVVTTLTDDDLSSDAETEYDPTGRIDDMVNAVEGRFVNKDDDFKSTDYPRVTNDTFADEDGDLIVGTETFELEVSSERAQRLATLLLNFSRRVATLEETYLSSTVRTLKPGDWFTRESNLRGFPSGKNFEVEEIERRKDGTTKILAFEVDPTVDAWTASNAVDLSVPPYIPPSEIIDLTAPSITIAPFSYSGGGAEVPALRLTHAAYASFIGDEIIAEFGLSNGSGGISGQSAFGKFPGNANVVEGFVGLPPSTAFVMRFRARKGERYSAWSAFKSFTTTSVYEASTSGIADSFVGQDWGATASQSEAENVRAPFGGNRLYHTQFEKVDDFWGGGGNGTLDSFFAYTQENVRILRLRRTGLTAGQRINITSSPQRALFPVKPGQLVAGACDVNSTGTASARLEIIFRDAAGAAVSGGVVQLEERTTGLYTSPSDMAQRYKGIATAPAGAETAELRGDVTSDGTSTVTLWMARPQMYLARDANATVGDYELGFEGDPGADVTLDSTAGAIVDQGPLATAANAADGEIGSQGSNVTLSTSWQDIATAAALTIPSGFSFVKVDWRANVQSSSVKAGSFNVQFRLLRDGADVSGAVGVAFVPASTELVFYKNGAPQPDDYVEQINRFNGPLSDWWIDNAATAGNRTYKIQARKSANNGYALVSAGKIFAQAYR